MGFPSRLAGVRRSTDVLIVGGGPCGMLASLLLGKYGIPSILIERGGAQPLSHPRAHVLNTRTMEIMRKLGLEEEILARTPPKEDWTSFRYCEHVMEQKDLAWINHSRTPEYDLILKNSASRVVQLSQPVLEAILRKHAIENTRSVGAKNEILFDHKLDSISQKDKVAVVNGPAGKIEIHAKVIIATDGAKSTARGAFGIPIQGKNFLESFASVHFTSPDLARYLRTRRKAAMLTFVFNPSVIAAVFVAHDARGDGNFVTHLPFFPPAERPEHFEDKDNLKPLISRLLTSLDGRIPEFEIKSTRSWGMHATLAESFCSRDGWAALAGDAAHQYPPSGGFGVNVGLSEIDFLAHQLYEKGVGSDAVESYAKVRRPIAKETLKVALQNYERGLLPTKALGLERRAVSLLSSLLSDRFIGTGALMRRLAEKPVEYVLERPDRVEKLRKVVEDDLEALPLYFPMVDLGQNIDKGTLESVEGEMKTGRLVKHAWLYVPHLKRSVASLDLCSPFFDESGHPSVQTFFINPSYTTDYAAYPFANLSRFIAVVRQDTEDSQSLEEAEARIRNLRNKGLKAYIVLDKSDDFMRCSSRLGRRAISICVGGEGYVRQCTYFNK